MRKRFDELGVLKKYQTTPILIELKSCGWISHGTTF
jgi:hypothetical protein